MASIFPFFPKYRAKVLLIEFDSLHLWSDGDWDSCAQVFFVQHLCDRKASRTKRAINHSPLLAEQLGGEGQGGREPVRGREIPEASRSNLQEPKDVLKSKGMQEGAGKLRNLKEFYCFVELVSASLSKGEHHGRER